MQRFYSGRSLNLITKSLWTHCHYGGTWEASVWPVNDQVAGRSAGRSASEMCVCVRALAHPHVCVCCVCVCNSPFHALGTETLFRSWIEELFCKMFAMKYWHCDCLSLQVYHWHYKMRAISYGTVFWCLNTTLGMVVYFPLCLSSLLHVNEHSEKRNYWL